MNKDLQCPYCEEWNEVCHDDGDSFEEDKKHEMQCHSCEKNFVFQTRISFDYYPDKADCLNGAPHQFREWQRVWGQPVERRYCRDCGAVEERTQPDKKP